eukprot:2863004-Amphidinium_carterae.2
MHQASSYRSKRPPFIRSHRLLHPHTFETEDLPPPQGLTKASPNIGTQITKNAFWGEVLLPWDWGRVGVDPRFLNTSRTCQASPVATMHQIACLFTNSTVFGGMGATGKEAKSQADPAKPGPTLTTWTCLS